MLDGWRLNLDGCVTAPGFKINGVFERRLTRLHVFKLFLLLVFSPWVSALNHPPTPPPPLSLFPGCTLRGLLENACDHSSRLLPWQPGPTHPTRHSHSVKHPLSRSSRGPCTEQHVHFTQTERNTPSRSFSDADISFSGFYHKSGLPGLRLFKDDVLLEQKLEKTSK